MVIQPLPRRKLAFFFFSKLTHAHFVLFCFYYLFIYLFLAALGLHCCAQAFSSCGERGATLHCGARASHFGGFSCCGARVLGARASVVVARRLSSCGSQALEHRLSSCGPRASLLRSMWDLPGPGLDPSVPCIGRWILNHCTTGEVPKSAIFKIVLLR